MSFEEICERIEKYSHRTSLLFMLASMNNFANNGRVSHVVAKMAGLLGIRVVGRASDAGELEPLDKCRGEKKAFSAILSNMKRMGYKGRRVRIGHCYNENAAKEFSELVRTEFPAAHIEIYRLRGLCCYYAEVGGMLVGFER